MTWNHQIVLLRDQRIEIHVNIKTLNDTITRKNTPMNKTTMLKSMHKLKTMLKGTVHPRIKIHIFPFTSGAVNRLDCFGSCRVLEILHVRDASLLSTIMEIDGTQLVVLKAPKKHIWQSRNRVVCGSMSELFTYVPSTVSWHGKKRASTHGQEARWH